MAVDKKRALTDPTYRASLTPEEVVELEAMIAEDDLDQVAGGLGCGSTGSCLASKRSKITNGCSGC
jgi:hypothetical protein